MKPILFNTEMVRAILEGLKTVTRRAVKPQPRTIYHDGKIYDDDGLYVIAENQNGGMKQIVPPYQPGEILYVRETFCEFIADHVIDGKKFAYKADATPTSEEARKELGYKWRPSIHMPREAARIFLRVTDLRVERMQDIDDDGVVAEGLNIGDPFDELWNSTIKKADRSLYGWKANPWVWVIEFEQCEKPKGD